MDDGSGETGRSGTGRGYPFLRAARLDRGWSQARAAQELARLAERTGGGRARPGSLKTQLSRWENGHATPAPGQRALLAELYGSTPAGLGLEPAAPAGTADPDGTAGTQRLRAALDRSAAIGDTELRLLGDQLRAIAALDGRLGTAAAHGPLAALVEQLRELLSHCVHPERTVALAELLAGAALLAGDQEHDRAAPDRAWLAYGLAADAALRAGDAGTAELAARRRDRLRAELRGDRPGEPAPPAPERYPAPVAITVELDGHPSDGACDPPVRDQLEEILREAVTAHRAGEAGEAAGAAARARQLALRSGSARALAVLARLGR
ncbi:helix-turn-helix transcriptional regulator [Pseudonocardia sp. NPDC049635]|uniref:helix-turn-helix transcriptional regulator n=1 Tax=Pseudonocardia sp. NPDC049635 TaxID=3155506 RepID=UPI0033D1D317